jgi:Fe-S-cluster containining protein
MVKPYGRIKLPREAIPAGATLCEFCTAKCCRYFALPIDTPTTRRDFDFLRWFLLHEHASAFVEDDIWYLLVHTACKHLQPDNRCGIYETRPQICREYTTDNCEYEDDYTYEHYFETSEQVAEYVDAIFPPKRGESLRSPKPELLPVLAHGGE